ncbi:MAG TPA: universal stress protein [Thermoflexia bacterium]|nr:universal stress protein [Thermoflexia bacterium]
MNEQAVEIRRILVALDASPHSRAALEAAAELAARFHAVLRGLFVEDVRLLQLAQLPSSQEIGYFSASRRQLDTTQIERQLRVQAKRARRAFALTVKQMQVASEFHVTRGVVAAEVLAAVEDADLLVLGRAGWSRVLIKQLGSTARSALAAAPNLMLIAPAGGRLGPPVQVLYDGSPAAEKSLLLAETLMEEEQWLTILLLAGVAKLTALHHPVQALLCHRVNIEYQTLPQSNVSRLLRLIAAKSTGLLIMPLHPASLTEDALLTLLPQIKMPVLLVR